MTGLLIFGVKIILVILAVEIVMGDAARLYLEVKKELKDGYNKN